MKLETAAGILVVEDDPPMRRLLAAELEYLGYRASVAGSVDEARLQLERTPFDLLITDLMLPDGNGLDVLDCATGHQPGLPVLVLSGRGTIDDAVQAIKRGATDFLQKPIDPARLALVVAATLAAPRQRTTTGEQRRVHGLVGSSPPMVALQERIAQIAATDTTVLIQGESGTGKELVARALHAGSPRAAKPFIAIDCGALDGNLLASELFGHVRGAFTGADTQRQGLIQAAHQGTLFLDEIGNLSLELQARLLRVVQERKVRPVGGDSEREVDVRVVAATNSELRAAIPRGLFRQDLYYRLAVVTLTVPPLRERSGDVQVLALHLADAIVRRMARPAVRMTDDALKSLDRYSWPGNVRELANVVERAVILAQNGVVEDFELPLAEASFVPLSEIEPLDDAVRRAEGDAIRRALKLSPSKSEAARRLGISRRALYEKLDRLEIKDESE